MMDEEAAGTPRQSTAIDDCGSQRHARCHIVLAAVSVSGAGDQSQLT